MWVRCDLGCAYICRCTRTNLMIIETRLCCIKWVSLYKLCIIKSMLSRPMLNEELLCYFIISNLHENSKFWKLKIKACSILMFTFTQNICQVMYYISGVFRHLKKACRLKDIKITILDASSGYVSGDCMLWIPYINALVNVFIYYLWQKQVTEFRTGINVLETLIWHGDISQK